MALGPRPYAVCGRAVGALRRGGRRVSASRGDRDGTVKYADASNGVRGLLRQIGKYAIIPSFSKKQRSLLVG